MKYIFTKEDGDRWGFGDITGISLSSAKDFSVASASLISVNGSHGEAVSHDNDRLYFALAGSGFFEIEGHKSDFSSGSLAIVPKGTHYDFGGDQLELIVFDTPAFSE